jgi:hypothetical protein
MLPTKSFLQVRQRPDGTWYQEDAPDVLLRIAENADPPRDVLAELGVPKDWAELERWAQPLGFCNRYLEFVLVDEGPTRLQGGHPMRPAELTFMLPTPLVFDHLGFVVGALTGVRMGTEPERVEGVTGDFLIGTGRLYRSPLAAAAWRGIERGLFPGVCAVHLFGQHLTPPPGVQGMVRHAVGDRAVFVEPGKGLIAEVGIVHQPACPGAKFLRSWEEPAGAG